MARRDAPRGVLSFMLTSKATLTRDSATLDLVLALAPGHAPGAIPELDQLASWSVVEIQGRLQVGEAEARALFAAFELGRRRQSTVAPQRPAFDSPAKVWEFAAPASRDLKFEVFRVMVLDSRNRLLGEEVVSRGILTASLVHPREVFRPALLLQGAAVIVVHNHPSGDATPSKDDDGVTERLARAGDLLGISLLDHIVLGEREYWSYRERGSIESRFDLAAPRGSDGTFATHAPRSGVSSMAKRPDPYAFVLAPPGGIEAGHVIPVEGGYFGILTRGAVVCRTFLPLPTEAAVRRAFRDAGFDGAPTPLPKALVPLGRCMRDYFKGEDVDPAEMPVTFDAGALNGFAFDVYKQLRRVRRGKTVTYRDLAGRAGHPAAARSVGGFMARNRFPLLVPCHRVLASNGGLGGFSSSGGLDDKRRLLAIEGILDDAPAAAR